MNGYRTINLFEAFRRMLQDSDEELKEFAARDRLYERLEGAKKQLGEKYICHPKNHVRRK